MAVVLEHGQSAGWLRLAGGQLGVVGERARRVVVVHGRAAGRRLEVLVARVVVVLVAVVVGLLLMMMMLLLLDDCGHCHAGGRHALLLLLPDVGPLGVHERVGRAVEQRRTVRGRGLLRALLGLVGVGPVQLLLLSLLVALLQAARALRRGRLLEQAAGGRVFGRARLAAGGLLLGALVARGGSSGASLERAAAPLELVRLLLLVQVCGGGRARCSRARHCVVLVPVVRVQTFARVRVHLHLHLRLLLVRGRLLQRTRRHAHLLLVVGGGLGGGKVLRLVGTVVVVEILELVILVLLLLLLGHHGGQLLALVCRVGVVVHHEGEPLAAGVPLLMVMVVLLAGHLLGLQWVLLGARLMQALLVVLVKWLELLVLVALDCEGVLLLEVVVLLLLLVQLRAERRRLGGRAGR